MATGNMNRSFGEIGTYGFWDMQVGQTNKQTNNDADHNTSHKHWGWSYPYF